MNAALLHLDVRIDATAQSSGCSQTEAAVQLSRSPSLPQYICELLRSVAARPLFVYTVAAECHRMLRG